MALVPPSELQVDIFVTNAKRVPRPMRESLQEEAIPEDELAPPEPHFIKDDQGSVKSRTSSDRYSRHSRAASEISTDSEESAGSDVDLSYYAGDYVDEEHGELGHEDHVLDYTNFDGDDDSILPGEDLLNLSVRKEGRRRRSYIRRASMAVFSTYEPDHRLSMYGRGSVYDRSSVALSWYDPTPAASASAIRLVQPSNSNINRPMSLGPISEGADSPPSTAFTTTPTSAAGLMSHRFHPSPLHQPAVPSPLAMSAQAESPPPSPSKPRPLSQMSQMSQGSQMTDWSHHSLAQLVNASENVRLELTDTELADISVVAERARPGKPKLDRILADEVERSKGAVIVGCKSHFSV